MIGFEGTLFDGITSRPRPVRVSFSGDRLRIVDTEGREGVYTRDRFSLEPPLGTSRRFLRLTDGGRCETADAAGFSALERAVGANRGLRLVHILERSWKWTVASLAVLTLCTGLFVAYGIPLLARTAAFSLPMSVLNSLSEETLELLDDTHLEPTELTEEEQAVARRVFEEVHAAVSLQSPPTLLFRRGGGIGANAFALPSGVVVITDEMVESIATEREMAGLLRHELAHVELRHGLRGVMQSTGVLFVVSLLAGDAGSISSLASTLPVVLVQQGYSRSFEYEADAAAAAYLLERGWGVEPMKDLLVRVTEREDRDGGTVAAALFSSHPELPERLEHLDRLAGSR